MENTGLFERIQSLCDAKGFTIAELERMVDVGNGVIRRWKKSVPTADKLQKTAKVLGVTMDYLINGNDIDDAKVKVLARKASELTDEQLDAINIMIDQFTNMKDNK